MNTNTATSILVHDPDTARSWYLDTAAPTREMVTLAQLGLGMESIRRFGGYTTRPITVAEHCMRVGRIARALVSEFDARATPLTIACADLAGLIHDAPEAITGLGDVLRPAKTDAHREAEERALEVIVGHLYVMHLPGYPARYNLSDFRRILADVADVVHTADNLALYYEAMLWQPCARDWAPKVVADPMPDVLLPLVWPRKGEHWSRIVAQACSEVAAAARAL